MMISYAKKHGFYRFSNIIHIFVTLATKSLIVYFKVRKGYNKLVKHKEVDTW